MQLWKKSIFFSLVLLLPFALFAKTPPIEDVLDRALIYARLEPRQIQNWQKQSHKAPYLPRLEFGYERRLQNYVNVDLQDSVAVNSTGITVGPSQEHQVQNNNNNNNFEVKAIWYLDRLLFSKDDLHISAEARQLAHERDVILGQVRQFYFKRARVSKELELMKKTGVGEAELEIKGLEMSEAIAGLDGLTGGWFGEQLTDGPS